MTSRHGDLSLIPSISTWAGLCSAGWMGGFSPGTPIFVHRSQKHLPRQYERHLSLRLRLRYLSLNHQ